MGRRAGGVGDVGLSNVELSMWMWRESWRMLYLYVESKSLRIRLQFTISRLDWMEIVDKAVEYLLTDMVLTQAVR